MEIVSGAGDPSYPVARLRLHAHAKGRRFGERFRHSASWQLSLTGLRPESPPASFSRLRSRASSRVTAVLQQRHVVFSSSAQPTVIALWIAHTWILDVRAGDSCVTCVPSFESETQMQITNFGAPVPEPSITCLFLASIVGFLGAACWRFYRQSSLTKRCSRPLAVPMSSFHMTSTLNSPAKLAPTSGG